MLYLLPKLKPSEKFKFEFSIGLSFKNRPELLRSFYTSPAQFAFTMCVSFGRINAMHQVMANYADSPDLNVRDHDDYAFKVACARGRTEVMIWLMDEHGVPAETCAGVCLFLAVAEFQADATQLLLERGVSMYTCQPEQALKILKVHDKNTCWYNSNNINRAMCVQHVLQTWDWNSKHTQCDHCRGVKRKRSAPPPVVHRKKVNAMDFDNVIFE